VALFRTVAPTERIITVANAKEHLNVDSSHDDLRIDGLILAATAALDGRDGMLGRCLLSQSWRFTLAGFPCAGVRLPLPPTISVASVKYLDPAEVEQTLATDVYRVVKGGIEGDLIVPKIGQVWPLTACMPDAVRVDFTAGYATDDPALEPLRQAVRLLVKHWFDHDGVETIPDAVALLIGNYRFAPL
jgi:uncharacterized phiE125 gp8 family phage protein